MAQIRDIKRRMKAVSNIKRITRTMQMIATSKFARALTRATASKPYTEGVFGLVKELAQRAGNINHPLIDGPTTKSTGKHLVLFISSDRGLCGSYNSGVMRAGFKKLRELGESNVEIDVVGRKGLSILRFNDTPADRHLAQFGDPPQLDDADHLANDYMDRFTSGEIASVHIAYTRFISTARQSVEVIQLLPLKPPTDESTEAEGSKGGNVQYEFSPAPEELLDDLLPVTVRTTLYQCFNDSIVSEHVSRMIAMKAATDNAGKMSKDLRRVFNRARQAQITTELTEIISGSMALE